MINLICPVRIEIDDIESIINEKYNPSKGILTGLKLRILDRYAKYIEIEAGGRITSVNYIENEKAALLSLYGSKTRTAKIITDAVIGMLNPVHSDCCPYCGIGEIDQIDHYLPQEFFPEFSILHKNLIPICGTCNEIKGSHIPGQNGKNYLHLIFDTLPLEKMLVCTILFNNRLPTITFSIAPQFNNTVFHHHFSELKLKNRIEKKSTQYSLQIKALAEQFGNIYAKDELNRDLNKSTAFFGEFYWKTELISSMVAANFVDNTN